MQFAPTVVFDLDGTLVDTAPDLIASLNVVLVESGLAPVTMEDTRRLVGRGARIMIERGFELRGARLPLDELDRLHKRFLEHYGEHLTDESRAFPGATTALDTLAGRGARLAICTNKPEIYTTKLLAALGLADRFVFIAGSDTFSMRKPHPAHLLLAIEKANGRPEAAVFVGDSSVDVVTARAANIPVIAVSFGYSEMPASSLGADRLVDRLEDVPAAVVDLLQGQTAVRT